MNTCLANYSISESIHDCNGNNRHLTLDNVAGSRFDLYVNSGVSTGAFELSRLAGTGLTTFPLGFDGTPIGQTTPSPVSATSLDANGTSILSSTLQVVSTLTGNAAVDFTGLPGGNTGRAVCIDVSSGELSIASAGSC